MLKLPGCLLQPTACRLVQHPINRLAQSCVEVWQPSQHQGDEAAKKAFGFGADNRRRSDTKKLEFKAGGVI